LHSMDDERCFTSDWILSMYVGFVHSFNGTGAASGEDSDWIGLDDDIEGRRTEVVNDSDSEY